MFTTITSQLGVRVTSFTDKCLCDFFKIENLEITSVSDGLRSHWSHAFRLTSWKRMLEWTDRRGATMCRGARMEHGSMCCEVMAVCCVPIAVPVVWTGRLMLMLNRVLGDEACNDHTHIYFWTPSKCNINSHVTPPFDWVRTHDEMDSSSQAQPCAEAGSAA